MSRPDLPLILSPRAEDDFADILQYTLETWGEAQVFVYRAVLDKALLTIQQNPEIGHKRPELSAAHRIFPAGRQSSCTGPMTKWFMFPESCTNAWTSGGTVRNAHLKSPT